MAITWGVLVVEDAAEAEEVARSLFAENVVSSFNTLAGNELFTFLGTEQGNTAPYPWIAWEVEREPAPDLAAARRALRRPDATHDELDELVGICDIFALDADFRELAQPVAGRYRCLAGLDGLIDHLGTIEAEGGDLQHLARHFRAAARFARRHGMLLVVNR